MRGGACCIISPDLLYVTQRDCVCLSPRSLRKIGETKKKEKENPCVLIKASRKLKRAHLPGFDSTCFVPLRQLAFSPPPPLLLSSVWCRCPPLLLFQGYQRPSHYIATQGEAWDTSPPCHVTTPNKANAISPMKWLWIHFKQRNRKSSSGVSRDVWHTAYLISDLLTPLLIGRPGAWDCVWLLEDDLAGTVGLYRHGNQSGGGWTGMLNGCLVTFLSLKRVYICTAAVSCRPDHAGCVCVS